jgi:nucleotide-binding universal stress UspA family protein
MKFLVAVDDSPGNERVLDHAEALAAAADATLVLVHAVDPSVYDTMEGPVRSADEREERLIIESTAEAEDRGADILERAAGQVDPGVAVETELLYGPPAESIAEFAGTAGADGIIVGHRNLSEARERVLGSVAKQLVEQSPIPVTVVR